MAGPAWEQVAVSRAVCVPVMLAPGRPYGMWREVVLERLAPRGRATRVAVDIAAFVSFQVPVLAAILWIAGADGSQMAAALGSASMAMVLLRRP